MAPEPQSGDVTHGHLLVAIGRMEEQIKYLGDTIKDLNLHHQHQIQRWETHQQRSDDRHNRMEQRMAQVVILAVVASIAVPVIINAMDAELQFGNQTHTEIKR